MRRLLSTGAVLAVLAVSAMAAIAVPASAAVPDLTGRSYVSLGDSYAAAWGLPLAATQPAAGCDQSDENYPHLVADEFGLDLDDRSCGGAVIANVVDTPQSVGGATAPVQSDALDADTDLVTLTIGGNDLGFWQLGQMCIAATAGGPVAGSLDGNVHASCAEQFVVNTPAGPVNTLETQIDQTVAPALSAALADIGARAPHAKVIVVGYPALAPDAAHTPSDGCYTSLLQGLGFRTNAYPYTNADVELLYATQVHLDDTMAEVTAASGATYVSLIADSVAHTPCNPTDAYVNGITLSLAPDSVPVSGLPVGGIKKGAIHPNAAGAAFTSTKVSDAVRALFAEPDPTPTPTITPTPTPTDDPSPTPTASPSPSPTESPSAGVSPVPSASATPVAAATAGALATTGTPSVVGAIGIGAALFLVGVAVTLLLGRRVHS